MQKRTFHQHQDILSRLQELYFSLIKHDGFGDIHIEIRILKRGQKEVILHCGKQYRYIVNCLEPGSSIHEITLCEACSTVMEAPENP